MKVLRGIAITALAVAMTAACSPGQPKQTNATPGPINPASTAPHPTTAVPTPTVKPSPAPATKPAGRYCDGRPMSVNATLLDVRFGSHATFDRLAFDFCAKDQHPALTYRRVTQLRADPSDQPVSLKGRYFYVIRLGRSTAHTDAGANLVSRTPTDAPAGRNIAQRQLIGDVGGIVSYGVGVNRLRNITTGVVPDPNDPRHVVIYFDVTR